MPTSANTWGIDYWILGLVLALVCVLLNTNQGVVVESTTMALQKKRYSTERHSTTGNVALTEYNYMMNPKQRHPSGSQKCNVNPHTDQYTDR